MSAGSSGKWTKPNRKHKDTFELLLRGVIESEPDILLLHESPRAYEGRRGNRLIREVLEATPRPMLVLSGHTHWAEPPDHPG